MLTLLKQSLWKQFGASIDTLDNAIAAWPEDNWDKNKRFFYIAYHSLFFLDFYLSMPPLNFSPKLAYTLTEKSDLPADALDDIIPDQLYTKQDLLDYLHGCREKCRNLIDGLTEERLTESWIKGAGKDDMELSGSKALHFSVLEILIYNMRHVQHHAGQLNMLLRQSYNHGSDFVSFTLH